MSIPKDIQEDDKIVFDYYGDSTLAKAYRLIEEMWNSAYNALTLLDWRYTFSTHYGATCGRTLRLNPDGLRRIDQTSNPVGYTAYLLVHEAGHVLGGVSRLFDMLGEFPGENASVAELTAFKKRKTLVNIAADHAINLLIAKANEECWERGLMPLGEEAFPALPNGCCDEQFNNMSAENIFIDLYRNQPDDVEEGDGGDGGDGDPDDGDGADTNPGGGGGDTPDDDTDEDSDEDAEDGDTDGGGEDSDEESDEDGDGEGGDTDGDQPSTDEEILGGGFPGGGADDILQPELEEGETLEDVNQQIEDAVEQVITQSELDAASKGGMVDSALRGVKDQRNKREPLDWKQYVRDWQTVRMNDGWTRPFNAPVFNATDGLCAPGRGRDGCGAIIYIVDSSWSMDDRLTADLLVAGQELLDNQRPDKLIILSVSNKVRDVITLVPGDTVPDRVRGGGGTEFLPAFEWVQENEPYCDGIVYLTDGYSSDLRFLEEPACPLLWVSYGVAAVDYPIGDAVDAPPSRAECI
jgi:hypothetical protein